MDARKLATVNDLVEARLAKLSKEEKIGQLIQAELASVTPDDVRQFGLGSILNGGGVFPFGNKHASRTDWFNLAQSFQVAATESAAGIPILWGTDAVHGHNNVFGSTIFPHNIGLGAANDSDLLVRIGKATARDVSATGINWVFAPTVAVPMDYRWGRTYEGYSQEPSIVGKLGSALIRGLQGEPGTVEFLSDPHVVATSKHFVGEGATVDGTDQGNVTYSERELLNIHAVGHVSALRAGAQCVMAGFNSWHDEKVHGSRRLLQDVLKCRRGFGGMVVSDWDGFVQLHEDLAHGCVMAVNAGVDILKVSSDWKRVYELLIDAVDENLISSARLGDAVRRVLRVKALKGLLSSNNGQAASRARHSASSANIALSKELARDAVRKSLVLLKNDNQVLPLRRAQKVLLVGVAVIDVSTQCGGWTLTWQGTDNSNADFPHAYSIADGIRAAVSDAGGSAEFVDRVDSATMADVALVVFGETPYAEGEGDLNHLSFSGDNATALEQMRVLRQLDIPVVALFLTGRPRWINPELNAADAFVVCWLPGTEAGAVADV